MQVQIDIVRAAKNQPQKPFVVANPDQHTMGGSLNRYLEIKIHPLIDTGKYKKIVVIGRHDRSVGINPKEKTGKMYNWQRPTAFIRNEVLYLMCFPGLDYVKHYASIVATHLSLTGKDAAIVSYVNPSDEACWEPILKSGYSELPINKGVMVGYGLPKIFPEVTWVEKENFHYSTFKINGAMWTLLVVKHSFWGDIGGRLSEHLSDLGFKKIIFIGKLGAIDKTLRPNMLLATGNATYVEGEVVTWKNLIKKFDKSDVVTGVHFTMPSVLFETKSWLADKSSGYRFIDPEVGQFAKSCVKKGTRFSYLHIISDNISKHYKEDLSNERNPKVLEKRAQMISSIRKILLENL